jgi:hypothetical protein
VLDPPHALSTLAYLRTYGSLMYVPNPKISKGDKLEDRSIKGYLISYDSSNIYHVWVQRSSPLHGKVIRTCDIRFDETKQYDPAASAIVQSEIVETFDIPLREIPLGYLEQSLFDLEIAPSIVGSADISDTSLDDSESILNAGKNTATLPTPDPTPIPETPLRTTPYRDPYRDTAKYSF